MANYYYKRYKAKVQYLSENVTYTRLYTTTTLPDACASAVYETSTYYSANATDALNNLEHNLLCDIDTGFSVDGTKQLDNWYLDDDKNYIALESATRAYAFKGRGILSSAVDSYSHEMYYRADLSPVYVADTYVTEVVAADGTYPDDGYNESDGYYYVKDRLAVQFYVRVSGAWKVATAYARVGGAWKKAQVHPRLDGKWYG